MSLGFVVVQLDVTIVNVALKSIGSSIGGAISGLQWVVNAYTLAFASLILTAGTAGDRLGAKRVFIGGFAMFVASSLGCALSPNLPMLIAARIGQGLGAAILVPCSLALLNRAYPDPKDRAGAVSIWAAGASAALAAGPVIGGLLITSLGWRSIFFINVPLGLLGIGLTMRYAQESEAAKPRDLDLAGQILAIVALVALAGATIEGGALGWTNPLVLAGYAAFVLSGGAFLVIERRAESPMLPLKLFKDTGFSANSAIGLLMNIGFYGLIFVLSLFFQQIQGYTVLATGLAFLPMTAVVLAANLLSGRITGAHGPRIPMFAGQLLIGLGCLGLLPIARGASYASMSLQLIAIGAGCGLTVPAMTSALLGTAPKEQSGIASGILNSCRQTGSTIGVALFGSLIADRARFVGGFHVSLGIAVALSAIGCGLACLATTSKPPPITKS